MSRAGANSGPARSCSGTVPRKPRVGSAGNYVDIPAKNADDGTPPRRQTDSCLGERETTRPPPIRLKGRPRGAALLLV